MKSHAMHSRRVLFAAALGLWAFCATSANDTQSPPSTAGFRPPEIQVPDGFTVELAAGPPLVTHPTMACFDDQGRLYVCNNAGVNLNNEELERQLPNSIHRLEDRDRDGKFDSFTLFADKLTFPMGGAWHDGALYVASPPNIWRLRDTNGDGLADERKILVSRFGYNGNAASIHGCFFGPDGRLYWTDGYHGHEFKDSRGNVTSQREGSYIFSCRPDGSDTRIHCGGGMDNPVEVDFTDSGDMLGTVNIMYTRPRVDCLVHWLHGGAYPHRERVLNEIKVTGGLLGPAHRFGHVAVSGLTRYRSGGLDQGWTDGLFTTFFNSGKLVRLSVFRKGSTYSLTEHEFLSSSSRDFHPTDVLEDADGSLLIIDTGGWFYRGCPTSQLAKPELLGGIYRVHRLGMSSTEDPRGLKIDWPRLPLTALRQLLNDPRFVVRERAIAECAARGSAMLTELTAVIAGGPPRARMAAVWAVARMVQQSELAESACVAMRPALIDPVAEIRQAACRCLSLSVAEVEAAWLLPLLDDADAAVRRQAATTLGMLGKREALPRLVAALDRDGMDRSEEHAIVYAMIEIADPAGIRAAMHSSAAVRHSELSLPQWRGTAVALDQIDGGNLQLDEIELGLNSGDKTSRTIAAGIAKRHPEWTPRLADMLSGWLGSDGLEARADIVEMLLAALVQDEHVAAMAGGYLGQHIPQNVRSLVTRAIATAGSMQPHKTWIEPLRYQLSSSDEAIVRQAIAAVRGLPEILFDDALNSIAQDHKRSIALRVDALAALAQRGGRLDEKTLRRLVGIYQASGSATARSRAAQIIGESKINPRQLLLVTPLLTQASPMQLRDLIACFQQSVERDVAESFLASIDGAQAFLTLADNEFSDVIKRFPPEVLDDANRLLDRLKEHRQQKMLQLEVFREKLPQGDATRGKMVFYSEKAKCSACHRVGEQGARVGPDLTTIGANRSASDLLESLVFPSASIVRDYESVKVLTADGRALTGLVASESIDTIELQQSSGEKVLLKLSDIEQLAQNNVSLMPAGLEEALTESELLDVVAYLQSLYHD